jgi:serine phosphatase RsbU (regulator of sigma subunit)
MGRLRSALRAYALEHDDPAEVLSRLDRKLCHFEGGTTATVLYAVGAPPYDTMLVCTAGHPAPLMARSGQSEAQEVPVPPGLILGFNPEQERQSHQLTLEPGAALVLYTDGLVERVGRPGTNPDGWSERHSLVRRSFRSDQDAETICTHVIAAGLGDESVEDDVAVIAVRRIG